MFIRNLAAWDRIARAILGFGIVSLAFWGPRSEWAWLGLILPATAALGHCPIYVMLGLSTCSRDRTKSAR
jgi:hypothetical protein